MTQHSTACRVDVNRVRMAKKRSHEEIENIDDVDGPMSSTSIHGAVVTLLPVKKGRKAMFFDGLLAIGVSGGGAPTLLHTS